MFVSITPRAGFFPAEIPKINPLLSHPAALPSPAGIIAGPSNVLMRGGIQSGNSISDFSSETNYGEWCFYFVAFEAHLIDDIKKITTIRVSIRDVFLQFHVITVFALLFIAIQFFTSSAPHNQNTTKHYKKVYIDLKSLKLNCHCFDDAANRAFDQCVSCTTTTNANRVRCRSWRQRHRCHSRLQHRFFCPDRLHGRCRAFPTVSA